MKDKIKNIIIVFLSMCILIGTAFAIPISNIGQEASSGDMITASWVNDVNKKIQKSGNYIITYKENNDALKLYDPGITVDLCTYPEISTVLHTYIHCTSGCNRHCLTLGDSVGGSIVEYGVDSIGCMCIGG